MYKLIVDSKEKDLNLIEYISNFFFIEKKCLDFGDYYIEPIDSYIERKTFIDLYGSVLDGRINTQISKLQKSGKNYYFFIFGNIDDIKKINIRNFNYEKAFKICNNQILSMLKNGIKVFICSNYHSFVISMEYLIKNKSNEVINHSNFPNIKELDDFTKLLSSIKTIGVKTAEKLSKKYKNINILLENIDNLKISKGKINNIKKSFGLI